MLLSKQIKDAWPGYRVTDDGFVFNPKGKRIGTSTGNKGYFKVTYKKLDGTWRGTTVHRVVAEQFLEIPTGLTTLHEVNHLEEPKTDNRSSNLEWTTPKGNTKHAWDTGLATPNYGASNGQSKITKRDALEIRRTYAKGDITQAELGQQHGLSQRSVSAIVRKETWACI